jgi:hypothetical protein
MVKNRVQRYEQQLDTGYRGLLLFKKKFVVTTLTPLKECPIATSVLNDKYKSDRKEIAK